jgi:hypothetical protein
MGDAVTNFNDAAVLSLFSEVTSHALKLGLFERVNQHEPANKPGNGLSLSIWTDVIRPLPQASTLNATSGLVSFHCRIQSNMLQKPEDDIDPRILTAVTTLIGEYSANFTLDGTVRNVDLLGQSGTALSAQAGYLNQGGTLFRVMVVTLPVIISDLWSQGA